jgi:hypothetical protein
MALEKSFAHLYDQALDLAAERDGQLLLMMKECNSTRKFSVLQYHYAAAEKAVNAIGKIVNELRLLQTAAAENIHLRIHQAAQIKSLLTPSFAHVMDLYREGLMVEQLKQGVAENNFSAVETETQQA